MNNSQLHALLELDRSTLPSDGGEQYNRLIFARSPYLLQHAANPTDWREWGEEAFSEALRRGVPLFVSIGYATCHWCHVMAQESFSDQQVAEILNQLYVPVKIDREERPDLDDFYMTASRLLTGSGGWPLNVFVDHDRRPFFAITYLPKNPRGGTPGFINLLQNISILWHERPQLVDNNASEIISSMAEMTSIPAGTDRDLGSMIADGVGQLQELFDNTNGGFGTSPKFPMPVNLLFLLKRNRVDFPAARSMALQTLRSMARGGINDQLGGGMHRYAVDREWLVPHFEKMLYDQALLIIAYVEAYRITGEPILLETALSIARFALAELAIPEGGFCAALDADTEGVEGMFYTWSVEEVDRVLGTDGSLCKEYWGVCDKGHLEGRSILHLPLDPVEFAVTHTMDACWLSSRIETARGVLLAEREKRERPLRDPKVICAWNGFMITALVRLAGISGDPSWFTAAEKTAVFILQNMVTPEGRLLRSWLGSPAPIAAFAEDYAAFCLGLAELAATGAGTTPWKDVLGNFGGQLQRLFVDADGKVSSAGQDSETLPVTIFSIHDAIIPSAVALTAMTCIRMGEILDDPESRVTALRIIRANRGVAERNPAACLALLMAEEELANG